MEDLAIARALHVLAVVLWIGGVAMVTTVLLPAVQHHVKPGEQVQFFEQIESRFAKQARWTTALVGVTGFWLTWRFDLWSRFAEVRFWWMHAMVNVWFLFTVMLFVLERCISIAACSNARAVIRPVRSRSSGASTGCCWL
jgi:uncharacterized membrane protein